MNHSSKLLDLYRTLAAHQRPRELAQKVTNSGVAELHIYGAIGASFWDEGITADTVKARLDAVRGAARLNIFINSPGGSIFEADAIYSQLRRFPGEKVAYIDGLAASAASYIALGADRVVTAPHGKWLIHNAATMVWDVFTAAQLRAFAEKTGAALDKLSQSIAALYVADTGKPLDEVLAQMDKDEIMTAQEALDFGLTDSIATFDEDNAPAPDAAANRARNFAAWTNAHQGSERAQRLTEKLKEHQRASARPAR